MATLKDEHLQWLALNEHLILLGDGLFRVNDPTEKLESSYSQSSPPEDELLVVDTCSSTLLMQKLRLCPRCLAEQNAYCQFTEYRFKALAYYWYVQQAQLEEARQKVYYSNLFQLFSYSIAPFIIIGEEKRRSIRAPVSRD